MYNSPFTPFGPTYLVGLSQVQVSTINNMQATSYRVRNILNAITYFAWSPPIASGGAPSMAATAPLAGQPSANVMGMAANDTRIFCLPDKAWFIASAAAGLEITPGEGV